ncbi:MAG: NAD-dependent epimerase/dehydratase family protein [Bacteroidales bacterium]|jgi:nucleoside-diphosphate-sugar epimerase
MKTVFVTGANGLLGTNLVLELLRRNYAVKALVRDKKRFIDYTHPNLQLIIGDIRDRDSLEKGMKDCTLAVHTAADTSQKHLKLQDYDPVNLQGTKNILEICRAMNMQKLVYIGTANTFGYGTAADPGNEERPPAAPFTGCLYAQSKNLVQEMVDAAARNGINVVTISPSFMIGPYDYKPSSGRILRMALNRKIVFYPPGGKNFVHAADVARGVVNALEGGQPGEKYLIVNENLTFLEFFRIIARLTGKKPLMIPLVRPVLMVAGYAGNMLRTMGIPTSLSLNNMKILCIKNYYTNRKALSRFNMTFLTTEEAVRDALKTGPFRATLKY